MTDTAMTVTTTLTSDQEAALKWLSPDNPQQYLEDRIAEVLNSYVSQYRVEHAPITADQGIQAFLNATPEQQQQIMQVLGIQPQQPEPTPTP